MLAPHSPWLSTLAVLGGLACRPHVTSTIELARCPPPPAASATEPFPAQAPPQAQPALRDCAQTPSGQLNERDGGLWLNDDEGGQEPTWLLPHDERERANASLRAGELVDRVCLPPFPVDDEWTAPGPMLAVLSVHCEDLHRMDRLCLDLVARGRSLSLAFAGPGRTTPRFYFALPADSIRLTPTQIEGLPATRVFIDLPVPWSPWPQCWMAELEIEVDDARLSDDRVARSRTYIEFGKCE